jgi:hypothetical protein
VNLQTIEYHGFPQSIQRQIDDAIEDVTHLLPGWVAHLHIRWDGDDNENNATVSTEYEYRRAVITICPAFLSLSRYEQNHTLIHEIGHIITDPFASLTDRIVETLVPEGSRPFALGEVARHKEMLAEDIAIFTRRICRTDDDLI